MIADIDETKAPLLEHLIELRSRLLKCVIALAIAFVVAFNFADQILRFLIEPLVAAQSGGAAGKLIYTKLYEAFFVQIKVSLFAAFIISFPIIANQLWAFVAPGLYKTEKRAFLPFLLATPILFTMGASLAYYGVMPVAFHFFLGFQQSKDGVQIDALPALADYLSLVMQFIFAFAFSFLLPVLLLLLERAGIVTRAQLVAGRRYAIVAATALAAVLTPPDAVSMLMLAVPLCLLYEGALAVMWFTERRRANDAGVPINTTE